MGWKAPERPPWVDHLIAYGDAVGGADRIVGLDPDELVATACASVGLDDFGDAGWRAHYEACLASLERDARPHLVGRVMARTEILRTLRNRLRLTALWRREPGILEAPVREPVFIIGGARTGTSILFELMASDADTRSPAMWQMEHPVEFVEGGKQWAEVSHRVQILHHDLQPEYETMHANSGHLPNECSFMIMHEFMSDDFGSMYGATGFLAHLARADQRAAFRFHRRFLQTLQSPAGSRRWLLKCPSHQSKLHALFAVYPDARIIRTHRDPLKSFPSMIDLMATLQWMRTPRADPELIAHSIPRSYAQSFRQEIEDRASGRLPDERFVDVLFADLVRDPAGTVRGIYEGLGWEYTPEARDAIAAYARSKPRGAHGVHHYSLEGTGLDAEEQSERFAFYMEHYGIPREGA